MPTLTYKISFIIIIIIIEFRSAASFRAVPNNSGFQRNAGGSRISLSDSFGDDDVKCNCGLPAKR